MPNNVDKISMNINIPRLALTAVVVAVLLPAAKYSMNLQDPTPTQLLVAVCIGVFSSVLCLWLLDAVSMVQFRSSAVSKSIYAAAIISILGTGAGVFQGAFAGRKWPYEGAWTLRVRSNSDDTYVVDHRVVLIHSESADVYWGYSEASFPTSKQTNHAIFAEVVEFAPEDGNLSLLILMPDHEERAVHQAMTSEAKGARFVSKDSDGKYSTTLTRPR